MKALRKVDVNKPPKMTFAIGLWISLPGKSPRKANGIKAKPPADVDFVTFGVRVTVYDEMFDEEEEYEITGAMDANIEENKISNESPMGASLFGHKRGETVTIHLPNGNEYELIIKKIELA